MSGECGKCGEHTVDCSCNLASMIITRIEDIGRIQERLVDIAKHEIFDDVRKHNTYWQSEDEKAAEKLDEVRRQLCYISDSLWDLFSILNKDAD